ncbi:MAG: nuclease domain-containing protein, partial [Solibacillus sp.]
IEKHGGSGAFCYIFDAKYAIHVDSKDGIGPEHRDINVMHRYRDAIVAKNGETYEREMFGAYVLFPWKNDAAYREHPLYKSIDEVNIGGLPFLPNETELVEQIIDNLLHKSAEELQRKGILPRGTMPYLAPRIGNLLVIHEQHLQNREWGENEFVPQLKIPRDVLPDGALQVQEIAIASDAGIHTVVGVSGVELAEQVTFNTVNQQSHLLKGNGQYSWNHAFVVPIKVFNAADRLEELFVQNETEQELVKLFKRISSDVVLKLDGDEIKGSRIIDEIQLEKHIFQLREQKLFYGESVISLETPVYELFKWVEKRITLESDF